MFKLRPVQGSDAGTLFPGIYKTSVTDTIQWDGPNSSEEYRRALDEKEVLHREGKEHFFTIVNEESNQLVGSINIRPSSSEVADIGLWIMPSHQGKGAGSAAIKAIVKYGFETLKLKKIEAYVFVGNEASRKIFEKNAFTLEQTFPEASTKRGKLVDVWRFSILK